MKEFNYYKEVNMAFGANIKIGQLFSITTSVESDKNKVIPLYLLISAKSILM